MVVEIIISTGGDEHQLEDFYHWLRADVDVVRAATVTPKGLVGSGGMGVFETVSMILSNTNGLDNVAIAYSSWRHARKNPPPLSFTPTTALRPDQQAVVDEMNRQGDE